RTESGAAGQVHGAQFVLLDSLDASQILTVVVRDAKDPLCFSKGPAEQDAHAPAQKPRKKVGPLDHFGPVMSEDIWNRSEWRRNEQRVEQVEFRFHHCAWRVPQHASPSVHRDDLVMKIVRLQPQNLRYATVQAKYPIFILRIDFGQRA